MTLRIKIELNNAIFEDTNFNEIGIILNNNIIDIIEECRRHEENKNSNDYYQVIKESNGNTIGNWNIKNK